MGAPRDNGDAFEGGRAQVWRRTITQRPLVSRPHCGQVLAVSEDTSHILKQGARVFARQLGKADIRGSITWIGPNRYGPGYRYGIRADDGSKHWVDEDDVTPEVDPADVDPNAIRKGSRVRITAGAHAGLEGDVYTAAAAGRFGVRDDDEETYWVDEEHLERV